MKWDKSKNVNPLVDTENNFVCHNTA